MFGDYTTEQGVTQEEAVPGPSSGPILEAYCSHCHNELQRPIVSNERLYAPLDGGVLSINTRTEYGEVVQVITLDSDDEEPQRVQSNQLDEMNRDGTVEARQFNQVLSQYFTAKRRTTTFAERCTCHRKRTCAHCVIKEDKRLDLLYTLDESVQCSKDSCTRLYNALLDMEPTEDANDFAAIRLGLCRGLDRLQDHVKEAEATKAAVQRLQSENM